MAKTKKTSKGQSATQKPGAKNKTPSTKASAPVKKAAAPSKKTKKLAEKLKLGTMASLDNVLTRVREKAEERGVDYVGVLKGADFVPKAVSLQDDESVRAVLARLGVTMKEEAVEAPKVEAKNVNTGAPKKAKVAPEEDEFIKRPRPVYTEDTIEVPKGFAPEFVIGKRDIPATDNNPLISSRLGWKYAYPPTFGYAVETLAGAPLGLLSKMRLDDAWDKASKGLSAGEKLPFTKDEFNKSLSLVKAHIGKQKRLERDTDTPILVQDFLDIKELDYRELMIPHASELVTTVRLACEYDIAETNRLVARWKKIRKYRHKVPLAVSDDGLGIFSDRDVGLLNARGIKCLNHIKSHNIVELKNMLLDKDFANVIEEINAAYKEDRERRRDAAYKTYPFAFTTVSLLFAIFVAFTYKYTIIKDALGASILNNTFIVWIFGLVIMTIGIIRTPIRRKKHSRYCFFTKKVKRKTRHLIELSIFTIAISVLFFQRYDGYNNDVYYRFVDDDTIAVAGLVDNEKEYLTIPDTIDGHDVVSIMPLAFSGDDGLVSVVIPSSVETLGRYAFSGCSALESISAKDGISGVKSIEKYAFKKCHALKGTDILATVESVGKNAFKDSSIVMIDLPSVKTLEAGAFKDLETLKSVALSAYLETIPASCFEGCEYVTEISNYSGVKTIEKKAFKNCISIEAIDLDGVETIGNNSFEGCSSIEAVVISEAAREIGKNAFKNCNKVLVFETPFIGKNREDTAKYSFDYFINCNSDKDPFNVVLRGMTSIHSKAFEDCSAIVSVDFGDTVTEIQKGAFRNATSLKSITLPDVISIVEEKAFLGCSNLSEINGIEHVTRIDKSAFEGCSQLVDIDLSSVSTLGESAFEDCYSLRFVGNTHSLTEIGKAAFKGCYNIEKIDFSAAALRTIGESAFENCSSLNEVVLPATVTEIPKRAFHSCFALHSFDFPNSVKTIGKEAFAESGIEDPKFNSTLSEIGEGAFKNCYDISTLVIPASVKTVGKNAFKDCDSLNRVEAPFFGTEAGGKKGSNSVYGSSNSVQYVIMTGSGTLTKNDMKAFKNSLVEVAIMGSVSEVGERAFKNFKYLDEVILGDSVKTIAKEAFYGCKELNSISLDGTSVSTIAKKAFYNAGIERFTAGDALRTIEDEAFAKSKVEVFDLGAAHQLRELPKKLCYGCESLYDIDFPSSLNTIGEAAFRYCDSINELSLRNVKTVGKSAFKNCDNLRTLELVAVSVIEKEAFASTGLIEVTIPDGCEELGKNVFKNCRYLNELTVSRSVKKMGKGLFAGCRDLETLELPYVGTEKDTPKKISYLGYYKSLTRIVITDAREIAKSAFKNCESLEYLTLNEGIRAIGDKVVDGCDSLYRVYMPDSLSKYDDRFPSGSIIYEEN